MMQNLKQFFKNNEKDIVLIAGVILISLISFGAGRLSVPGVPKYPITIEERQLQAAVNQNTSADSAKGKDNDTKQQINNAQNNTECVVVGSKNSSKYHYPWCTGAKNISEKNKICFSSKDDAKNRGYTPAGNCPGLQ